MEYVGFFLSKMNYLGTEWAEPLILDQKDKYDESVEYFYTKAKNPKEARKIIFENFYSQSEEDEIYIYNWSEIFNLSESWDFDDDYFFKEYEKADGKILDNICRLWNVMDSDERKKLDPFPMDDRFSLLSESARKKLCFNHFEIDIAIAPLNKL